MAFRHMTFTIPKNLLSKKADSAPNVKSRDRSAMQRTRMFGFIECLSVSFGGDTESRRSLLSGVYARGKGWAVWSIHN